MNAPNSYLAHLRGEPKKAPPSPPARSVSARRSDPITSHEGVAWYAARHFRYHRVLEAAKALNQAGTWFDDAQITLTVNTLHGTDESRNNLARTRKRVEDDGFLIRSRSPKVSKHDGTRRIHFRLATADDAAPHDHRAALKAQARAAKMAAEQAEELEMEDQKLATVTRLPLPPSEMAAELGRVREFLDAFADQTGGTDAMLTAWLGGKLLTLFASDIEDLLNAVADDTFDDDVLARLDEADMVDVDGVDHVRVEGHDCYMATDLLQAIMFGTEGWD